MPTTLFVGRDGKVVHTQARRLRERRAARGRHPPLRAEAPRSDGRRRRRGRCPRRAGGGRRVVPQPLRPAARARLPVGGLGRQARRDRGRLDAPRARARAAVRRELLGDLHRPRPRRDEARLVAQRPPRDAREGLGGRDHRARAVLPRHAVRRAARARVAHRRAHGARRPRRPARRRGGVRDRLDAVRRARRSARSSPPRRCRSPPPRARTCSPGTRPAWRSRSCSPRSPSTA